MKNITDTWLKNLKPKPEAQEFKDPSSSGLRIRITPKGVKTFVYSYSHPQSGKMKRVKLGTYPAMKLAEARSKWSELSQIRRQGIDPRDHLDIEKKKRQEEIEVTKGGASTAPIVTVTELINTYMNEYSSRHKKSWREEQRVLEKEFGSIFGNLPAHEITREQIRGIANKKRQEEKNTQAWNMIAYIRSMYNWAIESPEFFSIPFEINPATSVYSKQERRIFKPKPRTRRWHEDELRTILKLFPEQYKDLLTFILLTGSRFGEATSMRWSELYREEWRQTDTKNGTDHVVYLSTQAQKIIERQPKDAVFVWSNPHTNSGHVRQDSVHMALRKIDFGIDHWTVHDFRRALSSWLGKNLVHKDINDRMLNHTASGVYETYNQESYDEPAREWWQKWGDHIEELKNG